MIPAILSCIFVLYLYRTLNAPESDGKGIPLDAIDESGLINRIDSLNRRIENLTGVEAKK